MTQLSTSIFNAHFLNISPCFRQNDSRLFFCQRRLFKLLMRRYSILFYSTMMYYIIRSVWCEAIFFKCEEYDLGIKNKTTKYLRCKERWLVCFVEANARRRWRRTNERRKNFVLDLRFDAVHVIGSHSQWNWTVRQLIAHHFFVWHWIKCWERKRENDLRLAAAKHREYCATR